MAEITVPRWVLTQILMPAGRRTAPKPVLVLPKAADERLPAHYRSKSNEYDPPTVIGVFDNWEYRFWCACIDRTPTLNIMTECRCCGHMGENDVIVRRTHLNKNACAEKLIKAYNLLKRDHKCAICDNSTPHQKWGVPLCSTGCLQAWCESEAKPNSLRFALELIEV